MTSPASNLRFYEKFLISILKTGQIPSSIAFIMDGNRRYAKSHHLPTSKGHEKGVSSLKYCLEWCLELGVRKVATFALAIENLNREKKELDYLFDLAKSQLKEMAAEKAFFDKFGVKVTIVGDLSLLPPDVTEALNEVSCLTKKNKNLELFLCFCYNSEFEIDRGLRKLKEEIENENNSKEEHELNKDFTPPKDEENNKNNISDLKSKDSKTENITSNKNNSNESKAINFWNYLMMKVEPDIIIRTSNEYRLSNFMTFQSTNSEIVFLKENWPEINWMCFLKIILQYQLTERFYKKKKIEDSMEKN